MTRSTGDMNRKRGLTESRNILRGSQEYNRALFEFSPVGLVLSRMDGTLVDVNPAFAAILGRSVEETLELTAGEITPEKYAGQEREQRQSLEATGHYGPCEKEYLHRDGHLVPVRTQGCILAWVGERFIWSSVEEISERKRLEETLNERNEQLRLFVEHTPAAIAMLDREMRYIIASRRWVTDYKLGDREIVGRSHYDLFPEIPERWKEIHRRCLAGAIERAEEDPFVRTDGRTDWVRWEIRPWHDRTGGIGGIIIFSENITERKEAERELEKYREHLEELVKERTVELKESRLALLNLVEDLSVKTEELAGANERLKEVDRLKSLFIASMSHELRTPLNSIIGFSSILLNEWVGPLNDEQRLNLSTVLKSGRHLLALINDVIDVSKIEAGQIDVAVDEFDLYDLCAEAAGLLAGEARSKGLVFTLEPIHYSMCTDRRRLLQCLLNLISNAVKYTEAGTVSVAAAVEEGQERPARVHLTVADTGIGIAPVDRMKIFTPFIRLDSPLKGKVPGNGLGLYLTRKLVETVLGGSIAFTSNLNEGSIFTLAVPARCGGKVVQA